MAISVPQEGRVMAVRLSDVPVVVRRRYGRAMLEAAFADGDVFGAIEINAAIEEPSDQVYWVSEASARRVIK